MAERLQPTALVTGGTGFIGRTLIRRLGRDGWRIHGLVRSAASAPPADGVEWHPVPVDTEALIGLVRGLSPSACFHLATDFRARHEPADVTAMIEANVAMGTRLAEALTRGNRCPLVYTGTAWQHVEGRPYSPNSLYAATKQALEDILAFYAEVDGLPVATVNFFDTYGPDDARPKLVPLLLRAARTGEPLDLSSGEQLIDLLHVDDAVECLLAVASALTGGGQSPAVFSAHSDTPVTVRRLVDLLAEATGCPVPVRWGARPTRPREMLTPWRFATRPPGWNPRIPLEEGLRSLAAAAAGPTSAGRPPSPARASGDRGRTA
jgi:nucleoside-diphosphate-sugar epimerase